MRAARKALDGVAESDLPFQVLKTLLQLYEQRADLQRNFFEERMLDLSRLVRWTAGVST